MYEREVNIAKYLFFEQFALIFCFRIFELAYDLCHQVYDDEYSAT